jgi:hypothetical protein
VLQYAACSLYIQFPAVWNLVVSMLCFHTDLNFSPLLTHCECIQKFPDWVDNEIYAYNNKHSWRSYTKGYGGKTH